MDGDSIERNIRNPSLGLKFYDFSKNEDSAGERHDTIMQTTRTERQEFVPSYY